MPRLFCREPDVDIEEPDPVPGDLSAAVRPELVPPNLVADLLAWSDSDDRVDERGVVLVETALPWGNRRVGPTHHLMPRGAYVGNAPRPGRRDAGTGRRIDPEQGGAARHGKPAAVRRRDAGTAWVGEVEHGSYGCPACGDAIGRGSRRYCDACGASGHDRRLLAQLVAAVEAEAERNARGLAFDPDTRLVRPLEPEAAPAAGSPAAQDVA
jgi:hypothetical protein